TRGIKRPQHGSRTEASLRDYAAAHWQQCQLRLLLLFFHFFLGFARVSLAARARHSLHEWRCLRWWLYFTQQDGAKGYLFAVDCDCGVIVLLYHCTFQD